MIFAVMRAVRARPSRRQSTLTALGAAAGVAVAGSLAWGLVALLTHKQLSLIGLVIGLGVGATVTRFRPGHRPAIIAGAVIAVAGCALGTLLGQVFLMLSARWSLPEIFGHLSLVARAYPSNVGWLGVLFYALAAFGAVRVPLQASRRSRPTAHAMHAGPGDPDDALEGNGG
jgi:hypothetical protein